MHRSHGDGHGNPSPLTQLTPLSFHQDQYTVNPATTIQTRTVNTPQASLLVSKDFETVAERGGVLGCVREFDADIADGGLSLYR